MRPTVHWATLQLWRAAKDLRPIPASHRPALISGTPEEGGFVTPEERFERIEVYRAMLICV